MARDGFLKRHSIVRNAIKEDLLFFALPAVFVFGAGLIASALERWNGLVVTIGELAQQPRTLPLLSVQSILGLALILLGYTILLIGQITLRRFHSPTLVIKEDHQLITHGIYRLIRHPMYLGVILVAIGVPICVSSLSGLLIMSVLILVFLIRIRIEERMLIDEFGEAYDVDGAVGEITANRAEH